MAHNANEELTEDEKFVAIKSAEAIQPDDNKFKLTSKAALMQVWNVELWFGLFCTDQESHQVAHCGLEHLCCLIRKHVLKLENYKS